MYIYTDEYNKIVTSPTTGRIHTNTPSATPLPDVVTDGLIMWLNGGSYSGSGDWIDLKGNYNMTVGAGVTYSSANGGKFITASSANSQVYNADIDMSAGGFTMMSAGRYYSPNVGRMHSQYAYGINFALGWSGNAEHFYNNGWVYTDGGADQNWRIYTVSQNSSFNDGKVKINNVAKTVLFNNWGLPHGIYLGAAPTEGEYSNCEFGFFMVYNKILSDSEITQNYNAYKNLYGLT